MVNRLNVQGLAMSTINTPDVQRPLLIAGRPTSAADLALRRILHAKKPNQPLVVIDYHGGLANALTQRNKGNLHKNPVLWCDIANRRRPTALFAFRRSVGMKPALRAFLARCAQHFAQPVSIATIDAVVDLADRLADQGSIGLASLLRSLRRPEFAMPMRRNQAAGGDLDRVIALLDWAARFPAVWAVSEGNNGVDLGRAMAAGGTVWIEMPAAHFERLEHQLVSWMVEAALMDALLSINGDKPKVDEVCRPALVVYGFPTVSPLPMVGAPLAAKHVGVFGFSATTALPAAAQSWLDAGADCWVTGALGVLPVASSKSWLDDAERHHVNRLASGQVWVRSGRTKKAVTMLVRPPDDSDLLPHGLRRQALKRLRLTSVKQFSSALTADLPPAPQNADLFTKLCAKETLYAGWFRVKGHNRKSHGHDQVTIEQFELTLDAELERLVGELSEGRYRSRPLRTARIPKADGEWRVLRIACVRDRVVQAACLHLIEPLFDIRFSPASFAYRPGRSAHHAVALARSAIRAGKHFVVTADIRKCFDSIDHDILLRLVGDVVSDRDLIQLLRGWLTSDVIDFMDIIPAELGVPQGEAISPLLANIYLDPLDKEFEQLGVSFVRYADDYLVLCDTEADAQAKLRLMDDFLQGVLRLTLKPGKTQYAHITQGVRFLGFDINLSDARIAPDKVANAVAVVGDRLDAITSAEADSMERWQAAVRMNALVRGFRNYFLIDDAPGVRAQLSEMDSMIEAKAAQRFDMDRGLALIWSARERFLRAADSEATSAKGHGEATALTGAYAQDANVIDVVPPVTRQAAPAMGAPGDARAVIVSAGAQGLSSGSTGVAADVLLVAGRLHVMTSGCYVTVNGDDVLVRRRKGELFRTPIAEVTMVYLEGKGIAISADLTMRLCEHDIPVVFTPLIGIPAAIAQPVQSLRSNARQQQVLRRNDPEILKAGLRMLAAKVANQASVLKYFARYRKRKGDEAFGELTRCADELRDIASTLDGLDPASAGVRACGMGHEGRAAAKYWSSFCKFVPGDLSFPGRHTRHATDPVNSAINYVYSLLYGEVWRAVIRAGLDPYFGIMHGTERDQGSLVFDLIEEYRAPFGDRLVIGMFGRGFALELDGDGRLRAACRRKLVTAFHKLWHRDLRWRDKMRSPGAILEAQVSSLKNTFLGHDDYRPFRFRW